MILTDKEHKQRVESGREGGTTTKRRYGHHFYSSIGTKGGNALKAKYGREYYSMLGKASHAARKARKEAEGR